MGDSYAPSLPVRLPGLNGIRFYAAISVLVGHVSNNFGEMRTQASSFPLLNIFLLDPQSGVNLFFVLSGFLITCLLLREKSQAGEISIRKFYARRILRIWPLYYGTLLAGTVILPLLVGPSYPLYAIPWSKSVLLLLFLPNFLSALGPLSHLWSIGLEEQFYLTWPWIVNHKTAFLKFTLGVLFVKIILTPVIQIIGNQGMANLFLTLRFECMAVGALGAYLFFNRHQALALLHSVYLKLVVFAGFALLAIVDVPLSEPMILASSLIFLLAILYVVSVPKLGAFLDLPLLDQLGKVSYGIYMIHYPATYLVVYTLYRAGFAEGPLYDWVIYTAVTAITLASSFASYYGFERPFLKIKDRFAVIPT